MGWATDGAVEGNDLDVDVDRLLQRSYRSVAASRSAASRSAWRTFSRHAPPGENALDLGTTVVGLGHHVAIALQLGKGEFALREGRLRLLDRLLRPERASLRSPRVFRAWSGQALRARLVPRSRR